ncbi:glycerate kinase [Nitrospira sp.]|nr:glycerate kinase [Nitrospira sp.]
MARALERMLGTRLQGGCVVTKYGHGGPTQRIQVLEAGHPIPDQAGQVATQRILAIARGLSADDLLFVVLSGGASSLLPAPAEGLSLTDKQRTTDVLLKSGADIRAVNAVRKHLSAIKGGRLAGATKARVETLVLSDVLGDDLASIGSGVTAPDPTTFADARMVLQQHHLWDRVPRPVRDHIGRGCRGEIRDTPKPGSRVFRRVHNEIVGNNQAAVDAAANAAWNDEVTPLVLTTTLTGEAREAARAFGALARQIVDRGRPLHRPCCIIAGGELTVTVRGSGTGGRAQEFALTAAKEIAGLEHVWVAGVGTDGTDGPTDAAGAVVDGTTWQRAASRGLQPARAVKNNDAYPLLKRLGHLITTGPTGTNVNDLYLLLVL